MITIIALLENNRLPEVENTGTILCRHTASFKATTTNGDRFDLTKGICPPSLHLFILDCLILLQLTISIIILGLQQQQTLFMALPFHSCSILVLMKRQ